MEMSMNTTASQGCGSAHCACSGQLQIVPASINGIALHEPGEALDGETLRERAYAELLRQRAVHQGLLPRVNALVAPELDAAERQVIEAMTDDEVTCPEPTDDECRRYYEANKAHFIVGQALHVRHILAKLNLSSRVEAAVFAVEARVDADRRP